MRQWFSAWVLLKWPPRSPDLTPCDFFLWVYVKGLVYVYPLPAFSGVFNFGNNQTWLLATSGCFQNWIRHWKDPVLRVEKKWCGTRRRRWTPLQKKTSRGVSSSGRIGGLSVWKHKGPTLKGIRVQTPSGMWNIFSGLRSDTF